MLPNICGCSLSFPKTVYQVLTKKEYLQYQQDVECADLCSVHEVEISVLKYCSHISSELNLQFNHSIVLHPHSCNMEGEKIEPTKLKQQKKILN